MSDMKKYKEIKPNDKATFNMLYYAMNRTIDKLENLIKYDCKTKNIPEAKYNAYIRVLRKKNDQMVARYKYMQNDFDTYKIISK